MFRNRLTLTTGLSAALAVGSFLGLTTLTGAAHATAQDLSLSSSVNCSNLAVTLTAANAGANPEYVYFQLNTSAGTTVTSSVTVPANSTESSTFPIAAGTIVETGSINDPEDGDIIQSLQLHLVFSTDEDCTRPASHELQAGDFHVSCTDGWLHLSVDVENIGDYSATVKASADGAWSDPATAAAAAAAGWNFATQFPLAAGQHFQVEGDFKVDDQYQIEVRNLTTGLTTLVVPAHPLSKAELACGSNVPEVEEQAPSDTTVTTTAGSGSTGSTLPSTGGSSWALALAALIVVSVGGLLVRTTRRTA